MDSNKKILMTVIGMFLFVFSILVVFQKDGLIDLNKKHTQLAEAIKDNDQLKEENKDLFNEVNRLKRDQNYIEQVARKELGMIKSDEYIVKFSSNKQSK